MKDSTLIYFLWKDKCSTNVLWKFGRNQIWLFWDVKVHIFQCKIFPTSGFLCLSRQVLKDGSLKQLQNETKIIPLSFLDVEIWYFGEFGFNKSLPVIGHFQQLVVIDICNLMWEFIFLCINLKSEMVMLFSPENVMISYWITLFHYLMAILNMQPYWVFTICL